MPLYLNRADAKKWTRADRHQYQFNAGFQKASEDSFRKLLVNVGISPDEAYREMEDRTMIVADPAGEFATWAKLNAVAKSVSLGKLDYTYRQSSEQTGGKVSLSGQTGIVADAVEYKNAGTVVPIIDHGVKRDFREYLTFGADGFDTLVDDMREGTKVIMRTADKYMWDGDATIVSPDGNVWEGIKNETASIVQTTTAVNFADPSNTGKVIVDAVSDKINLLRITNNCSGMIDVAVSRAVMSYWARTPYSTEYGSGSILKMIETLPGVKSVYEEPQLTTNSELLIAKIDIDGLHAVTGQAMSNYMVQRVMHNDPYIMVKWMAQGYIAKADYKGQKTALYCKAA